MSLADVLKKAPLTRPDGAPPTITETFKYEIENANAPPAAPVTDKSLLFNTVHSILTRAVEENGWQCFYTPKDIDEKTTSIVADVDFGAISEKYGFKAAETAMQLSIMKLVDIAFCCDNSGSMIMKQGLLEKRVQHLEMVITLSAEIACLFDDDGVSLCTLNGNHAMDNVKSAEDVRTFMSRVVYDGPTPLGTVFRNKFVDPLIFDKVIKKPLMVIMITDGEPTYDNYDLGGQIKRALSNLRKNGYPDHTLSVQIAQVGEDRNTQEYLSKFLDTDPVIGPLVDVTSSYKLEKEEVEKVYKGEYTEVTHLLKTLLGALSRDFDRMDEAAV